MEMKLKKNYQRKHTKIYKYSEFIIVFRTRHGAPQSSKTADEWSHTGVAAVGGPDHRGEAESMEL